MKNLFALLGNLTVWFFLSFESFWLILWYNKLPKVSMYHLFNYSALHDKEKVYNDKNCQVIDEDDVPKRVKDRIICQYINALYQDESFKNNVASIHIPLFDGKEIIGSQSLRGVLTKVKEEML